VTETTEAPASSDQTEAAITAFRHQLEGQVSVSASLVQDSLLDLWGLMPEGDSRSEIERWITETLGRSLYAVQEVDARLAAVLPASVH
jgi:hypothetical protein